MIRYKLICPKSHDFEAWFSSSDGCDAQIAKKLVACPTCGSTKVAKALMAPSVVTSEQKTKSRAARNRRKVNAEAVEAVASPPMPPAPASAQGVLTGPQREMLQKLKNLRDKVLADAEYVGPRFAEEARKRHGDDEAGKGIYGEASPKEVKDLLDEGIEVLPLPVLPGDHN